MSVCLSSLQSIYSQSNVLNHGHVRPDMLAMQQNFCWWENRSVASNLVKVGGITPSFKHSCHNFKMALVGGGGGGWWVAFTVCGSLSLYLLQLDINLIKVPPYSSFSSSSAPPYTWRISTQTCLQFAAESNVRVWPYLGQGRLLWRTKLHQVSLSISKYFQKNFKPCLDCQLYD